MNEKLGRSGIGVGGAQSLKKMSIRQTLGRYVIAIVIVTAATAVRLVFLQSLGTRYTFLTLYPAVILAALYGGFGAGLLATALSACLADYFWIEPVGHFSIQNPADRVGIAAFLLSGAAISIITEVMRRARDRALAAEAEVRLTDETMRHREWLSVTLQSIGDAVITTDKEGRVTYLNPVAEQATGWKSGEAEGRPLGEVFNIINDLTREPARNPVERVLREGHVVGLANHTTLIRKDGSELPIEDSAAPIRSSGSIIGIVMVFHDVTEKRRAEETLRESERLLNDIIDGSAPTVIFLKDLEGRFITINKPLEDLLGISREEIKGKTDYDIITKDRADYYREHDRRVIETGQPIQIEETADLTDGRHILLANKFPLKDESGKIYGVCSISHDITERKRSEEALRESERRFREMLENVRLIAMILDKQGNIVFCNDFLLELTGWRRDEVIGRSWVVFFIPAEDHQALKDLFLTSISQDTIPPHYENPIITRGGELRLISWNNTTLRDTEGRVIGTASIGEDITDRKRAEEALRESERRERERAEELATMFDAVPTPVIIVHDPDATHMTGNRATDELLRHPRGSEVSLSAPDEVKPDHFRAIKDGRELRLDELPAQRAARGEYVSDFEFDIVFDDGTTINLLGYGTPLLDGQGRPRGAVHVLVDITKRKRFEEELEEQIGKRTKELAATNARLIGEIAERERVLEALRESEERFRLMVIGVRDYAIFMLSPAGEVVDWNKGAERLKGYTASEIIGKHFSCFYTKEDILDGKPGRELEYAASRGSYEEEGLRVRKDGSTFLAYVVITALYDANGDLRGYSKMVRDITERRRVEDEALRTQKLESLRVLAGGVAHDLNNMMVAVEANAGLALQVLGKDSPASEYLIGIENAAEKVAAFSKQILSFAGKSEAVREPVQLNDAVNETTRLLLASISKKAVLEYALSDGLPAIEANSQNIQQIVMNLIINASDALGDEKGTIRVSTGKIRADRKYLDTLHPTGLPEGEYVYLEVSDTGCGMSPDTCKRIFDPFYSTKFMGRGLGLSAVFGIVSVHGGAIGLETEEKCGAAFRVLLPVPTRPVQAPAPEPVSEGVWNGKGTILVVDDEKDSLTMAKKVLEGAGYSVLTAEDGAEAIEVYRENSDTISVVILDLIMPHMRGDEAAKEIRKIREGVNILLLSGYHEIDLTEISGGPGKTAILEKPYKITKLLGAVQDILKS